MIEGLVMLLAIPSVFVAPITGAMTWSAYRSGERRFAARSGAVFLISSVFFVAGHMMGPGPSYTSGNCFISWDARSNPLVCD